MARVADQLGVGRETLRISYSSDSPVRDKVDLGNGRAGREPVVGVIGAYGEDYSQMGLKS